MNSTGAPFANLGRNLRQLGHSPASWASAGIILVIQLLVTALGGPDRQPGWGVFEMVGLSREGFLAGRVWQVATYGLFHGGWWHAGVNALFVLLVGSRIEHISGRGILLKTLIGGVIGGGIGHLMLAPAGAEAPLLVGLSGGCLALLLLLTTLSPESKMLPVPVTGRSLGAGILIAELFLALITPALAIPGLSLIGKAMVDRGMESWFQMGHACHFGGGLAGWVIGRWLLRPRITLKRLRRARERREASDSR